MASTDTNPSAQSRPSPVQVRVFAAEAESQIVTKSFEEIFDFNGVLFDPRPISTVTMNPGQTTNLVMSADRSQRLIVIAAGYRDPYQSVWKASALITTDQTVAATATINADTVNIYPANSQVIISTTQRDKHAEE